MDIEFFRPIRISLDVVETDERLPSVKFKFEVESNAFSESFLYRGRYGSHVRISIYSTTVWAALRAI